MLARVEFAYTGEAARSSIVFPKRLMNDLLQTPPSMAQRLEDARFEAGNEARKFRTVPVLKFGLARAGEDRNSFSLAEAFSHPGPTSTLGPLGKAPLLPRGGEGLNLNRGAMLYYLCKV